MESEMKLSVTELRKVFGECPSCHGSALLAVQDAVIKAMTPEPEAIPFDYDTYLKGRHEAVTRDGRVVTQLVRFDVPAAYKVQGVYDQSIRTWTDLGAYSLSTPNHDKDLFLRPKGPATVRFYVYEGSGKQLEVFRCELGSIHDQYYKGHFDFPIGG